MEPKDVAARILGDEQFQVHKVADFEALARAYLALEASVAALKSEREALVAACRDLVQARQDGQQALLMRDMQTMDETSEAFEDAYRRIRAALSGTRRGE